MTEITLLDGSIGQELVRRSGDRATPLWSTQVMIDRPELARVVHEAYFAAGASIATTNTYATLRDRLARVGLEDQVGRLAGIAVTAALGARDAHGRGRVAGAIGPLPQSYRPDLCPPAAEAARLYAELVAALAPRVDLLLLETMSSVDQARGAMMAARATALPVWLAVSVQDTDGTKLRSGEPLSGLAARGHTARGDPHQLRHARSNHAGSRHAQGLRSALRGLCQWLHPDQRRLSRPCGYGRCAGAAP